MSEDRSLRSPRYGHPSCVVRGTDGHQERSRGAAVGTRTNAIWEKQSCGVRQRSQGGLVVRGLPGERYTVTCLGAREGRFGCGPGHGTKFAKGISW